MELHSQEDDIALADLYSGLEEVWLGGENHADQVRCERERGRESLTTK